LKEVVAAVEIVKKGLASVEGVALHRQLVVVIIVAAVVVSAAVASGEVYHS
jgi:hypothetical protein